MVKIGSNPAGKSRWLLIEGLIVLIAALTVGSILAYRLFLVHQQRHQNARREAFVKADKLALYSSIGFLEEQRREKLLYLISEIEDHTNVNAKLVCLFA